MRVDTLINPAFEALRQYLPPLGLVDVHTHIGRHDPDGIEMSAEALTGALARIGARAAVFPLHEPSGYTLANDAVLAAVERSNSRLTPFCRVDPRRDALAEARRCLSRGARGVKLHPHSDQFDLTHPAVEPLIALAAEQRVPVIIRAGSNVAPLGPRVLELCDAHPDARVILAHAGISDGEWLWQRAAGYPNLCFDLSWWDPAAILAILARVPPGQLLHASDTPYGTPMVAAVCTLRCCLQAGLNDAQIASVAGGQGARLLAGEETVDLGPAPTSRPRRTSAVARDLGVALVQLFRGGDPGAAIAAAQARAASDGVSGRELIALLAAVTSSPHGFGGTIDLLVVARALALTTNVKDNQPTPEEGEDHDRQAPPLPGHVR
jgi:predicted TIM-barrel fold metal-dependent hydrolase